MAAALARSGTKPVVKMDAGGTRVLPADQRTGQLVGGPEDLQKLGTIRAFVNREQKEATAVEAARDVTQLAFLGERILKDDLDGFKMKPVDNSYGAALHPYPESLLISGLPLQTRESVELNRPNKVVGLLRGLKDTEIPFWMKFQGKVFPPAVGKKRQPVGMALTPLSPQGKQLLSRVKQISPYVSGRMLSWLRSFSDERLQLAAISVTNAEFDDIFSSQLEGEEQAESELDWAEQEA